jgi:hypothetical protein
MWPFQHAAPRNAGAPWVAQAERCASAVPECFRDDPCAINIYLNGGRTFWGVEKMRKATFTYGEAGAAEVNACTERMPPRLSDEDVGVTPEQWEKCAALRACVAASPAVARMHVGLLRVLHACACCAHGGGVPRVLRRARE